MNLLRLALAGSFCIGLAPCTRAKRRSIDFTCNSVSSKRQLCEQEQVGAMPLTNVDLQNAAKGLISDYGDAAEREAQERFAKAHNAGLKNTATFWQEIQAIVVKMQADS